MSEVTTHIPVLWKTTREAANRALGENGLPILDQTLSLAKSLAIERKWPLQSIRIELYQDPEVAWEYLLLVLAFDCEPFWAERLWEEFLDATKVIEQGLNEQRLDLFIKTIGYEFECNPQL